MPLMTRLEILTHQACIAVAAVAMPGLALFTNGDAAVILWVLYATWLWFAAGCIIFARIEVDDILVQWVKDVGVLGGAWRVVTWPRLLVMYARIFRKAKP